MPSPTSTDATDRPAPAVEPVVRTCGTHGLTALLACARCAAPLCQRCELVFTEVGQRCVRCGRRRGATLRRPGGALRAAAGVAALAAIVVATGVYTATYRVQPSSSRRDQPAAATLQPGVGPIYDVRGFRCIPRPAAVPGRQCFLSLAIRNRATAPVQFAGSQQRLLDVHGDPARAHFVAMAPPGTPSPEGPAVTVRAGSTFVAVLLFDVDPGVVVMFADLHDTGGGSGVTRVSVVDPG